MADTDETHDNPRVTALIALADAATTAHDVYTLFEAVGDAISAVVHHDSLAFGVLSEAERIDGSLASGATIEPLTHDNPTLVNWITSIRQIADWPGHVDANAHIPDLLPQLSFRLAVLLPLSIDGETIGFLCALRHDDRQFDTDDRSLLERAAGIIAVAARNWLLVRRAEQARRDADARLEQLESLGRVTQRLATQPSLEQAMAVIGDELWRILPFVSCQVWELSAGGDQLAAIQVWGAHGNTRLRPILPAGAGIIGDVVSRGTPAFVPDATADPRSRYPAEFSKLKAQLFDLGESVMAAPLVAAGDLLGGLLMSRLGRNQFSADDFRVFVSFAGQIALALHGFRKAEENRELFLSTIRSLASLVDWRETSGHPHSDRVAYLSEAIAIEMQLPPHEVELVRMAAMLHDTGKIGIPENVLVKTDPLTDEERALLMTHPALGAAMIEAHGSHPDIVPLIRHHHEWYDGRGYPDGLAGDNIPLGAAIIGGAEAFERITSDMPYRRARSTAAARQLLIAGSGQQFHPDIVEAALRVIGGFENSAAPYLNRVPERDGHGGRSILTLAELQQRESQPPETFRILYEIAHEIGSIPELSRFLRQIAQIIGDEMGGGGCTIFLIERGSGELVAAASYPETGKSARDLPTDDPFDAVTLAREPVSLPSPVSTDGRYMVPLLNNGEPIGAIVVDAADGRRFRDSERRILAAIAGQIATAIGVAQQHDDARRGAITDGLTGVHNYRYMIERLEQELERDGPVSLMLIDLDALKSINDVAGHLAGDALLRAVAASLTAGVRRSDVVARYGGDEFVVLMPLTPVDEAVTIAERLATALDLLPERHIADFQRAKAASYGVSASPADGTTTSALLEAADIRMYAMKRVRRQDIESTD